MDFSDEIKKFIDQPHFMVLSTMNSDSSIQMTIVWYMYEDGYFKVSITTDRVKYKNIKRNPNVTFLIPDKDDYYKYIQVRGVVEKHTTEGGHDLIDRMAKRYLGKDTYPYDPDRREERVSLLIKPNSYFTYGMD